jgi:hypothetical protein
MNSERPLPVTGYGKRGSVAGMPESRGSHAKDVELTTCEG